MLRYDLVVFSRINQTQPLKVLERIAMEPCCCHEAIAAVDWIRLDWIGLEEVNASYCEYMCLFVDAS